MNGDWQRLSRRPMRAKELAVTMSEIGIGRNPAWWGGVIRDCPKSEGRTLRPEDALTWLRENPLWTPSGRLPRWAEAKQRRAGQLSRVSRKKLRSNKKTIQNGTKERV